MYKRVINVNAIGLALMLAGCGGGESMADTSAAMVSQAALGLGSSGALTGTLPPSSGSACGINLPPMPTVPAGARKVTEFGAKPDDSVDDTAQIQRALDSLREGEWLVFPRGKYLHNKSLQIKVKGSKLWGDGALLHGTNPDDVALWIRADNVEVYRFTKTAVTAGRRSTPWEGGISVYGIVPPNGSASPIAGVVIRGNRLTYSGAPGTNLQAGAGIFLYKAQNFLVAENVIERALADGIHMTAASRNGRVLNNVVRETGDDMIAVVSYMGAKWVDSARSDKSWLERQREAHEVSDILIANNDLTGQYWGRGITVVGGRGISIQRNRINRTTYGAAIYLARERAYRTFGVRNVVVSENVIDDNQVSAPVFVPQGPLFKGLHDALAKGRTGQAAIEIYSSSELDEREAAAGTNVMSIREVRVDGNSIKKVLSGGIRIGNYTSDDMIDNVTIVNNQILDIQKRHDPIQINEASLVSRPFCEGNKFNGGAIKASFCDASVRTSVSPTGANLKCNV